MKSTVNYLLYLECRFTDYWMTRGRRVLRRPVEACGVGVGEWTELIDGNVTDGLVGELRTEF